MHSAYFRIPALLIISLCCFVLSCSKDKYTTKPQLTIESINTLIPAPDSSGDGSLNVLLQYTSKKGNLGGGYFVAIRTRLNQDFIPSGTGNTDTFSGPIPPFPDKSKAEFQFTADYQSLYEATSTRPSEPDTIIFKFAAIDADKNSSDTITSPKIIILGQ
jgi:hypothetical protein